MSEILLYACGERRCSFHFKFETKVDHGQLLQKLTIRMGVEVGEIPSYPTILKLPF